MADTDDLRAASRALKDAISGLSRALGQGIADVGADVGKEIAAELDEAARGLQAELSGVAAASAERGARRSAKAEQTRADLIAAARSLFAERGYEATSVADIAKAAGYTKGALYAHFGSKEELFVSLFTEADDPDAVDGDPGDPSEPGDPAPPRHAVGDVMLSLEAYLYALRHPESRPTFGPLAERQLLDLARRVAHRRAGAGTEPTRDDRDSALALAASWTVGAIMEQVLPAGWDVPEALVRIRGRLAPGDTGTAPDDGAREDPSSES